MIDQGELFDILNPCIGVCEVNNAGYCRGCLRSRQERFHWNAFTTHQKQLVVNLCEKRRRKLLTAKQAKMILDEEQESPAPQMDFFDQGSNEIFAQKENTLTESGLKNHSENASNGVTCKSKLSKQTKEDSQGRSKKPQEPGVVKASGNQSAKAGKPDQFGLFDET